jgi:CheY-like chemotaxis protein
MTPPDLREALVMILDDHQDTLEMLQHALRATGAKVIAATSALAALVVLRHVVPSIVVVDLAMPDLDGFSFLATARAIPAARDLPMIAISGMPIDLQRHDWKDAGFLRAVMKPVDPFRLCAILAEVMEEEAATRAAGAVRLDSISGGRAASLNPNDVVSRRRSLQASRRTSRRLRRDSGELRLQAPDLQDLAARVVADR